MDKTIALVTPVLDDWDAFTALLSDIADALAGSGIVLHVYAVDDGSSAAFDVAGIQLSDGPASRRSTSFGLPPISAISGR